MSQALATFAQAYFHGTKADLTVGDFITVGHRSNLSARGPLSWVYFSSTLGAAIWGAELAKGEGRERIYVVEPSGPIEDDPNLTDKKFPGNPTMSFRSRDPLRIVGELIGWRGHDQEQIRTMRDGLDRMAALGTDHIID